MNTNLFKHISLISTKTLLDLFLETVQMQLHGMNHHCDIEDLDEKAFLQESEVIAYARGLVVNGKSVGYYWITHDIEQADTHDIIFSETEFKNGLYDQDSCSVKPTIPMPIDYMRVYENPEKLSNCTRESIYTFINAFPENQGIRIHKKFSAFTNIRNIVRATSDAIYSHAGVNTGFYIR